MWSKIVFFELRHYGDLHITRSLVRYVMDHIPARQYVYVLTMDKKVFADFPRLSFEVYDPARHPFTAYSPWFVVGDVLYVNTSCGANEMAFYQGTTVQTAHAIFSHYLRVLCGHVLPEDLRLFVPRINFQHFHTAGVDAFMSRHRHKRKILVVIGQGLSGQTDNFSMLRLVRWLSDTYPCTLFFLSNGFSTKRSPVRFYRQNVFSCRSIIGIEGNDIVETSYFSRFCDVIIGRASGVYTLSIEEENVAVHPKTFICFSHTERDKDLGTVRIFPGLENRFLWSRDFQISSMTDLIARSL
jgi:hypothetical protein